jgi:hypothetical protein
MNNDEALILLAQACKCQIDILERIIKLCQQERETEKLRAENAELKRRISEIGGGNAT